MMISTKGRYALRVMLDLASHDGEGYISLADIAKRQDVSMKYLEFIVSVLSKAELVESHRGKSGGYTLKRKPEEISVGEILTATEGTLAPVACLGGGENACEKSGSCLTLPLWKNLDKLIDGYLSKITLLDVLQGKVEP